MLFAELVLFYFVCFQFSFLSSVCLHKLFSLTELQYLRWEFIKENKEVRKKKENTPSTKRPIKKKRFLFFFSWSLSWSKSCFLSFFSWSKSCFLSFFFLVEIVFSFFFFLVESVCSCLLTFLFSFINFIIRIHMYDFHKSIRESLKSVKVGFVDPFFKPSHE